MGRRTALALAGLGLAAVGIVARRRQIAARTLGLRPAEYAVRVTRDVPTPMRDGVVLYADHFAPRGAGPFPTILIRTPYGRGADLGPLGLITDLGANIFAARGYNVVLQSVRGRFKSQGVFEPFVNEAADGRATLEWIARQPWFEGNLGMWGPSYVGYTQWAVAADAPHYLKALVPVITSTRFSRFFYPGGSFALESSLRWTYLVNTMNGPLDADRFQRLLRYEAVMLEALAKRPLAAADAHALGVQAASFQRWLNDPDPEGAYWRSVDQHRGIGRVDAAVHLVAGWHDFFRDGQLADYTNLLSAGRTPYLTVLPHYHTAPAVTLDATREGLWWFDAHLKGRRELLERRPVHLRLMGDKEWHAMDYWPPPARTTRFFLHPEGRLALEAPPADAGPARYCYDPADPTPATGGPVLSDQAGPRDQRAVEARADVLCYTSPPLTAPLDVVGYVRLELNAHSSLPHTDFIGRLCIVDRSGRSTNVCEGICRVTPAHDGRATDGGLRLEIDLGATAQRFQAGERIRLHVCSAAHPRWAANLGTGEPFAHGIHGLPAQQTIYQDALRPSALVLPVVTR
jgi:putative CocE/NonD family hydrolase